MDVAAEPVLLAPHDERHLRVDLEVGEAVDDVDARLLHRARPLDVPPLVEASLELDEAHRLLALLRALDERRDERRVVARPVHGRLDRDRVRVERGSLGEGLEARAERVVRVVDEQLAALDLVEDAVRRLRARPAGRDHRRPRLELQLRPVERDELPEVGLVEEALERVDVVGPHAEPGDEPLAQRPGCRRRHLEADGVAEAAAAELRLDRLEQVVGVVRELEVGVAGDAEQRPLRDLHPGEELGEEVRDDRLEGHELLPGGHETVEALGHLHPREALLARVGVDREHAEREREPGDVGERLARPDGERGEHREDLALEVRLEPAELLVGAVLDRGDLDPRGGQRRSQISPPEPRLPRAQVLDALADRDERVARGHPVDRADAEAGLVQLEQAGDADHEELVEVLGEDRGELDALEQRERLVLGDLEDAAVVLERRQLPVEEAARRLLGDDRHGLMVREPGRVPVSVRLRP